MHDCMIKTLYQSANKDNKCSGGIQAHHLLKTTGIKGMGLRSADNHTIPLCFKHHQMLHDQFGDEFEFFASFGFAETVGQDFARHLFDIYQREIAIFEK